MAHIILNHTLVQAEKACISIHDRGFRYGDGLFETIRIHDGVPYHFEWHMSRLARGLEAVRIAYDLNRLAPECRALIHANGIKEGLLRIQITRGISGRGYLPENGAPATCVIETLPLPALPERPVEIWGSSYARIPLSALPVHYKLCQGMNSTLARMEAADHGCFDALMLGENGCVAETSSANIFWEKDGVLFTPALAAGALDGAARAAIMEISALPVQETVAPAAAMMQADAVCLTNTAWGALPVNGLKPAGALWKSSALARMLNQALAEDRERYCQANGGHWQSDALSA